MIYTYEQGLPAAPAILFLHGGGLSSKSWRPVIERLPEFHCLAPDLPEQGQSAAIPYSIEGSAREVAEIIRQCTPQKKAHVVALSLGGPVAFTLLREAPELVDHVLLSGSSGKFSRFLASIGTSTIWTYKLFSRDYLIRETIKQNGILPEYEELIRDDLRCAISPNFMRHYMTDLGRWEMPETITQPLMLVVGEKEMKAAFGIAKGYLKRYPAAQGWVAPGANHAWSLQFPNLFAALVRAWVTDQPIPKEFTRKIT
jgi:pimeloyl-ACP methyl ester carboxylesterase